MSCCPAPASLAYLRDLVTRRHDIAIYPSDALDRDTPPEDFYLYRPSEVLVPVIQVELFIATATRLGIRVWRLDADPPPVDRDQANEGPGKFGDDAVARFAIGANADLDTVLDRLTRAAAGSLVVTPNHVLLTAPGEWHLSPADQPRVPEHIPEMHHEEGIWDVSVAVIDGGLPDDYAENPLLASDVTADAVEPWPYDGSYPVLSFPQGHGSFVAGVVRRHAPPARIRSYLAADSDGVTDEWNLGEQIDRALAEQPRAIVNLSLGAPSRHDLPLLATLRLGRATLDPDGPIVVAAAGNLNTSRPFWPAAEPWAIAVAAVEVKTPDGNPQRAWFSDWGNWVDVCAEGVDVISSFEARPYRSITEPYELRYFKGFALWSGTSFATPLVSAAVARLRHAHPAWLRQEVLDDLAARGPWIPGLGTFVQ